MNRVELLATLRRNSGFSVHKKVLIAGDDLKGLENLIQYIARCPFSRSRMIKVTDNGQIIYKTEHGGEMSKMRRGGKFIAFIEKKDQADIIEKIFKHCNLWIEPKARVAPGAPSGEDVNFPSRRIYDILEPEYISIDEFLANF